MYEAYFRGILMLYSLSLMFIKAASLTSGRYSPTVFVMLLGTEEFCHWDVTMCSSVNVHRHF
jgi:hypothetical protein